MAKRPQSVDLTIPQILLKGIIMEREASIPGKNSTSAHIHIPRSMAGRYIVILIPKGESGEISDTVHL